MFKRIRNTVRMAAHVGWSSTFNRLEVVLTEEDILRDLVRIPRPGGSTADVAVDESA